MVCRRIACLVAVAVAVQWAFERPACAQYGKEPVFLAPSASPPASTPTGTLQELVDQAISETSRRRMTAGHHTPWQIVHGIVALRWQCMLTSGNMEVNAIEWLAAGQRHNGEPLWQVTPYGGTGHPFTKPYAFEGHPTQFMGYMTMANIPLDYEFRADKGVITVKDIINDAKMQVTHGPEITWTLWALAHYEEPDAQWFNARGEPWSIERLVGIQTDEPVTIGACGGCHGLFALAYSRNLYLLRGKPLSGVWVAADQKVKRYVEEARSLQNGDGSFSSNNFKGPGYSQDYLTRLSTSGHQLEWLMIALPNRRLSEPWVEKAVENIARDLLNSRRYPADCGPLYHALHALVLYKQRTVPGAQEPVRTSELKLVDRNKPKPVSAPLVAAPAPQMTVTPVLPQVTPAPLPVSPAPITAEKPTDTKVQ